MEVIMDRPSRKTKSVNYCEPKEFHDDDEDFAPPSKKSKEALKQQNKKSTTSQESSSQSLPSQNSRKPLDVKVYERDLEAAISLSLLNPSSETSDHPSIKDPIVQTAVDENTEPSVPRLTNCSVDVACLGLDQITSDSTAPSRKSKGASDIQKNKLVTPDDEYQPCAASDSESDSDYSEHESEDENFTVKKANKTKKERVTKNGKAKQTPSATKQKKPQKSKSTAISTPTRTPLTTKNVPEPTRSVSLKVSKPAACLSPGVSKVPKWNPPGQIGKSPSSNGTPLRSPGQGLRLGLSRRVRVKPLHPTVASP